MKIKLFFLLMFPTLVIAQSHEGLSRTGIELKANLPKGFEASIEFQNRLTNFNRFAANYIYTELNYKINNHFTALAEFRYGTSRDWDRFRYGLGIIASHKINHWEFSARFRYQYQHSLHAIPEIGQNPPTQNFRLRIMASYKVNKKIKLFTGSEPLLQRSNMSTEWQRVRNMIGVDYKINKKLSLTVAYWWQPEFRDNSIDTYVHIANINLCYELPKWKSKKSDEAK